MKKLTAEEIDAKVDHLYAAYGSGSGVLFSLEPGRRDVVTSILKAFLRSEDVKKKLCYCKTLRPEKGDMPKCLHCLTLSELIAVMKSRREIKK